MGRYMTGDLEYKFWFGVQSSEDIYEFGFEESEDSVRGYFPISKKKDIEATVSVFKKGFKVKFKMTYEQFNDTMNKKGYSMSSSDPETETEVWKEKCRLAAKISLGTCILEGFKKNKDSLFVEAEL